MIEAVKRLKDDLIRDGNCQFMAVITADIVDLLNDHERLANLIKSRTVQEKDRVPIETCVRRSEDMGKGFLQLVIQTDGDVCVAVQDDELAYLSIEFCTQMAGGGKSPRTLQALRDLAQAMWEDQREDNVPW